MGVRVAGLREGVGVVREPPLQRIGWYGGSKRSCTNLLWTDLGKLQSGGEAVGELLLQGGAGCLHAVGDAQLDV